MSPALVIAAFAAVASVIGLAVCRCFPRAWAHVDRLVLGGVPQEQPRPVTVIQNGAAAVVDRPSTPVTGDEHERFDELVAALCGEPAETREATWWAL